MLSRSTILFFHALRAAAAPLFDDSCPPVAQYDSRPFPLTRCAEALLHPSDENLAQPSSEIASERAADLGVATQCVWESRTH